MFEAIVHSGRSGRRRLSVMVSLAYNVFDPLAISVDSQDGDVSLYVALTGGQPPFEPG